MGDFASTALNRLKEEEATVRDATHANIHMPALCKSHYKGKGKGQKKKKNSRDLNESSSCLFCGQMSTNISKHYTKHHAGEPKVAKILALKERGQHKKLIKAEWELLRNEGNHRNNQLVTATNSGELLVVRRKQSDNFSIEDYTPCPLCKGWYLKTALSIHVKRRCVIKTMKNESSSTIHRKSHVRKFDREMKKLDAEVFLTMRKGTLTKVAKQDDIIRLVGSFYLLKRSRNRMRCKNFASKHMRQAANLLQEVRKLDGSHGNLSSYIKPSKFSVISQAAINLAGGDENSYADLKHPSTLKNIGYEIKHYAAIKEELAIENQNSQDINDCKYFLKLYKRRWCLLSSSAVKQLEERQYNSEVTLPTSEDIQKFTDKIKSHLQKFDQDESVPVEEYRDLVELVEARLILFNKCRPGELEALRLDDFDKRTNNDHVISPEVLKTFSELENQLLATHKVVTVRGKRGRAVPILLPPDCEKSLLKLSDPNFRKDAGVKPSNPYLFANTVEVPKAAAGWFTPDHCLRLFMEAPSVEASDECIAYTGVTSNYLGNEVYRCVQSLANVLQKTDCSDISHLVKASNLRKYMATNCQLLNLNESELEWITRHLGHTRLTHLNNYRLSPSTIERTKIAKLLVILENGMLQDAQGSSLSDKELDALVMKKTQAKDHDESEQADPQPPVFRDYELRSSKRLTASPEQAEPQPPVFQDYELRSSKSLTALPDRLMGGNTANSDSEETDFEYSEAEEFSVSSSKASDSSDEEPPCKVAKRVNRPWSDETVNMLRKEFCSYIDDRKYPSFQKIRQIHKQYPGLLSGRTEAQVKSKLTHMMKQ